MHNAVAERSVPENLKAAIDRLAGSADSRRRRQELLARAFELRSGRERPGRFWKIDLDALDYSALAPARVEGPTIVAQSKRGTIACDISAAWRDHSDLVERALARAAVPTATKFAALSAALRNCGAFVYVPPDVALDEPIEISYAAPAGGLFPHTLVLAETGSECTVIERLTGEPASFVCGIAEIVCAPSAGVRYACEQTLPNDARHLWTRIAHPEADSTVAWNIAELGAALCAGAIEVAMRYPGARAEIDVLFFPSGDQHVDIVSSVEHEAGGSQSETIIKSAATDRGMARFLGNIRIARNAQGTDARLRDDALLLSPGAHIDSVPALEIAANDVKAFHGATVGAIDEEQIFYMGSRGIARMQAERMIALGFFEPVIARFPSEGLRERMRSALQAKIAP